MARKRKKSKDFKVYSGLAPTARKGFGMGGSTKKKRRRKKKKGGF